MQTKRIEIREHIASGRSVPLPLNVPGLALRSFVSAECGARGFTTGSATFEPGAALPYHYHDVIEVLTALEGIATVYIEGRKYVLQPFDCIHIPAGAAHSTRNEHAAVRMVAHNAFPSERPSRTFVEEKIQDAGQVSAVPPPGVSETIVRFAPAPVYEAAEGAFFRDLFAKRLGSPGICGGYGVFRPGSSLPCHVHRYDESITIVSGHAVCLVKGKRYELSGLDTAFIPEGWPHRFLNLSNQEMAMMWVYAGDEPDRIVVDSGYCSGDLSGLPELNTHLESK